MYPTVVRTYAVSNHDLHCADSLIQLQSTDETGKFLLFGIEKACHLPWQVVVVVLL